MRALDFEDIQKIDKAQANWPLIIVLDSLQTPDNIAGITRLAEAFDIEELVIFNSGNLAPKLLKKNARSAHQQIKITYLNDLVSLRLRTHDYQWIGIEWTDVSVSIYENRFTSKAVFVLGNERHGISEPLLNILDSSVHIPMLGLNSSMNVGHAAAVAIYEYRRQEFELQ